MNHMRYEIGEGCVFFLRGGKIMEADMLDFMGKIGPRLQGWKDLRSYPAVESRNIAYMLARDELLYRGLIKP